MPSNLIVMEAPAALRQSDYINARVLAAGVAETFQAPAGAKYVLFSAEDTIYCKIATSSTAAAIPAADVTDGTASEMNPGMRILPGDQAYISVIAPRATVVTIQYFRQ